MNGLKKDIEIIEVNSILFNELKDFHKQLMFTLNNLSQFLSLTLLLSLLLSLLSLSSSISFSTLYSFKNVRISKETKNWLLLFYSYKEECKVCKYFGHFLKKCSNILFHFKEIVSIVKRMVIKVMNVII